MGNTDCAPEDTGRVCEMEKGRSQEKQNIKVDGTDGAETEKVNWPLALYVNRQIEKGGMNLQEELGEVSGTVGVSFLGQDCAPEASKRLRTRPISCSTYPWLHLTYFWSSWLRPDKGGRLSIGTVHKAGVSTFFQVAWHLHILPGSLPHPLSWLHVESNFLIPTS